jgi:chorismate-pyruvate lyase
MNSSQKAHMTTAGHDDPSILWIDGTRAAEGKNNILRLNDLLLSASSTTMALEQWFGGPLKAQKEAPVPHPRPERCRPGTEPETACRRVRLVSGPAVLVEAENRYAPGLLTMAMRATLADTDTPFGRVVSPLRPRRRTLAATLLWSPPGDSESAEIPVPFRILEHRALLLLPDGQTLCEVHEFFTNRLLFPLPPRPLPATT